MYTCFKWIDNFVFHSHSCSWALVAWICSLLRWYVVRNSLACFASWFLVVDGISGRENESLCHFCPYNLLECVRLRPCKLVLFVSKERFGYIFTQEVISIFENIFLQKYDCTPPLLLLVLSEIKLMVFLFSKSIVSWIVAMQLVLGTFPSRHPEITKI